MSERNWMPLMDYAMKTGLSLSTLRRHIKAGKVRHKIENGRYLLWLEDDSRQSTDATPDSQRLQRELQKAREEIAELKTLIALYEETPPASISR
jgi:hypothetical protein